MSVLSLTDAKAHLDMTGTSTTLGDTELQAFIDASEAVLAKRVGPLTSTATTSRVRGGTDTLILPIQPTISLTSITPVYPGQAALDLTNITLNTATGTVTYQGFLGYFAYWAYDVVYQAGRASLPNDLLLADKELLRHLVTNSQRGAGASLRGGGGNDQAVAPYMLPNFVAELIGPYVQTGFA